MNSSSSTTRTSEIPRSDDGGSEPVPHPAWCNRVHQVDSDPRRQNHLRTWRSHGGRPVKIELLPFPADDGRRVSPHGDYTVKPTGPGVVLDILSMNEGGRTVALRMLHMVTSAELLALAEDLRVVAEAAELEGRHA